MKDFFRRMMMGRYGQDQLNQFISIFAIVFIVADLFLKNNILWALSIICLFVIYFRSFSKNINKRYDENMKFLNFRDRILSKFNKQKYYASQRKDFRIYSCPCCKQKIRVPKGKGKISIRCPKCNTSFIKKS